MKTTRRRKKKKPLRPPPPPPLNARRRRTGAMSAVQKQKKLEREKAAEERRLRRLAETGKNKRKTARGRSFVYSALGVLIARHAPMEYSLIRQVYPTTPPPCQFIEHIGYGSINPWFRTARFRKALIEYRGV